jgi:hypothetical protein
VNAETLRQKYKPDEIRVLFVGESPPAGGTFFYAANSNLFRAMASAFAQAFGSRVPNAAEFLEFFREAKCYLDDLCLEPVNHMTSSARRRARRAGEKPLAERLKVDTPLVTVAVPLSVQPHLESALLQAGLASVPVYGLPFPAMGHQHRFATELVALLRELCVEGVLPISSTT